MDDRGKLRSPGVPQLAEQAQRRPAAAPASPGHRRKRSIRGAKDSVEDLAAKTRSHDEKRTSPDSGSMGREGRQFTVGNIGNNGRIYLRYALLLVDHRASSKSSRVVGYNAIVSPA